MYACSLIRSHGGIFLCWLQVVMALKELSSVKVWGGLLKRFSHDSDSTKTEMKFSVFLPAQGTNGKVHTLYWLSGLTCTDENFVQKAGAFRQASEEGLAIVVCDTSPRGAGIEGEDEGWDFGTGASFYLNATQSKWAKNYNMFDYVNKELITLCEKNFPITSRKSVFGHSMGGHGALVSFFKNPGLFESVSCFVASCFVSIRVDLLCFHFVKHRKLIYELLRFLIHPTNQVSAFAPICNPMKCPWGEKAFSGYLGADQTLWKNWDASELVKNFTGACKVKNWFSFFDFA